MLISTLEDHFKKEKQIADKHKKHKELCGVE